MIVEQKIWMFLKAVVPIRSFLGFSGHMVLAIRRLGEDYDQRFADFDISDISKSTNLMSIILSHLRSPSTMWPESPEMNELEPQLSETKIRSKKYCLGKILEQFEKFLKMIESCKNGIIGFRASAGNSGVNHLKG